MQPTPGHERHNPQLLAMIPAAAQRIVEIGCSSGALAREYMAINAACEYIGVEIDGTLAGLASRHCNRVIVADIEDAVPGLLESLAPAQCWIFGDVLEHLRDPWGLLARLSRLMRPDDLVLACIPNMQHWSVQAHLLMGDLRYADSGLLDRTHLRWFTRTTIFEMFRNAGFGLETAMMRSFDNSSGAAMLAAIRASAQALGLDPHQAEQDALPLQYLIGARRAAP